ncbi:MAG TPA: hypothetical protein VFP72_22485 [Kineosporiaceae bacterium]|nr:hypothetical protein [Kineosporiaceae bacterium]
MLRAHGDLARPSAAGDISCASQLPAHPAVELAGVFDCSLLTIRLPGDAWEIGDSLAAQSIRLFPRPEGLGLSQPF